MGPESENIFKFGGKFYSDWKFHVTNMLRSHDLWGIRSGTETVENMSNKDTLAAFEKGKS